MRAGARALSLLAVPLNVHVLTELADAPRPLIELRRAVGSPPQTTMRGHIRSLVELGAVERHREPCFPGSVDYRLGPAGEELLEVMAVLDAWLRHAPDGPLEPGSIAARSAIKALTEGWSSTIVRALAAKPLSLTELSRLITQLNYPSLERRLGALKLTGQIEPCSNGGRSTPYRATEWLRRALAPLAVSARWERKHAPGSCRPIGRLDIESAVLLSAPMLRIAADYAGACRLAVDVRRAGEHRLAGGLLVIEDGVVVSCTSRLQGEADAAVTGTASAWLRAVIDRDPRDLELGGDGELAGAVVRGLYAGYTEANQPC